MVIVVHFKIEKATEVFERFAVFDGRSKRRVNEDLQLKLKRACGKFLNSNGTAFVNPMIMIIIIIIILIMTMFTQGNLFNA